MRALVAVLVGLSVVLAACGGARDASGPEAVVQRALELTAAKDIDGLKGLACAGQEELIRDQLSLDGTVPGAGMLGGIDLDAVLAAVQVDVSEVRVGDAQMAGDDVAQVPVSGSMKVTFDAEAMRPVLRQLLAGQGASMTDEQLDALLGTLESYGQAVPVDQSIRLIRESGAWKVCQDSLTAPAPS